MHNSTTQRNKQQVASQFNRAAHTYDEAARIQHFSALELVQQLNNVQQSNQETIHGNWLDLGCGTGFAVNSLVERGAKHVVGADLAHEMCKVSIEKIQHLPFTAVTCDSENLPFAKQSFDGIYSNLMIQWSERLSDLFYEAHRTLKPGGLFAFATLGPQTMCELRAAWQYVDPFVHVNQFESKADVIEQCERFFDIESIKQTSIIQQHHSLSSLLKELKAIGATNVNAGRRPGLGGRERLRKLEHAYRQLDDRQLLPQTSSPAPSQTLPLTYDLIWVVARARN